MKECQNIDRSNRWARDICLHSCISNDCFFFSYGDLDESVYDVQPYSDFDREVRKRNFRDCVEQDLPDRKFKYYKELRSECSKIFCREIPKEEVLKRDICLHKCVNDECFSEVYEDIDLVPTKFSMEIEEHRFRDAKKIEFIQCHDEENPENTLITYAKKRSQCAIMFCKNINKVDKFQRDTCIHECMSKECFSDIYPKMQQNYDTEEEMEQDRILLKDMFKLCFDANFTSNKKTVKSYGQKRSEISGISCKDVPNSQSEELKFQKDMCVHQAMHFQCY